MKVVDTGYKIDLHIHSVSSHGKDKGKVAFNTLEHIPVLAEKLNENCVQMCAITDHDVFDYVRELITLRKNHPAFRMGDADKVRQYMEFLPVEGSNLVAFILKDNANGDSWKNIIVAFNSRKEPAKLSIPAGRYTIVCKDGKIKQSGMGQVSGNEIIVPARSAMIIHQ